MTVRNCHEVQVLCVRTGENDQWSHNGSRSVHEVLARKTQKAINKLVAHTEYEGAELVKIDTQYLTNRMGYPLAMVTITFAWEEATCDLREEEPEDDD